MYYEYAVTLDYKGLPQEPISQQYSSKKDALMSLRAQILPATLWRRRFGSGMWEILVRRET